MKSFFGIILVLIFASCSTSHLHNSGTYTVESIQGDTVKFEKVRQKYIIPNADTLKVGQRLKLKKVKTQKDANVIPIWKRA